MYQEAFYIQEDIFRTIASQKRLEIIQLLHNRELSVTEMTEMLGIRQPNLSQHLRELRAARIVGTRKQKTNVYYHLVDERIAKACELIKAFSVDHHLLDADTKKIMLEDKKFYPIAVDPVCRMRVSVPYAGDSYQHEGDVYYFCASGCQEKFRKNPEKFMPKPKEAHGK